MHDLQQQLRDAVAPTASFDVEAVNARADRMVRRRRTRGTAAMVLVLAVVAGLLSLNRPSEPVLLEQPPDVGAPPAALSVFDRPPLTADELAPLPVLDTAPLPDRTRLAREVDGWRYLVAPDDAGGFCLVIIADQSTAHDGRCDYLPTAGGLYVEDAGVSAWLVPDGFDTVHLRDGRTVAVVDNVAIQASTATTQPAVQAERFTGPAGELPGRPPLGDPWPEGVSDGLAPPDPAVMEVVRESLPRDLVEVEGLDLDAAGVAVDEATTQVWVAPRRATGGACLLVVEELVLAGLECVAAESALQPFPAALRTASGGWAALTAAGWDQLELPGGGVIPLRGPVMWLANPGGTPETATLVDGDRRQPVALAQAIAAARPAAGPPADTGTSGGYAVFGRPADADDPRLDAYRAIEPVAFPAQADPRFAPAVETARLAVEIDDLVVFITRPREGDGVCTIRIEVDAEPRGQCRERQDPADPLASRGFSGDDDGVRMIEPIPDPFRAYRRDNGQTIPIDANVLVVQALGPADLSGTLIGPGIEVRVDLTGPGGTAASRPSDEAVAALSAICPPGLPPRPVGAPPPPAERREAVIEAPPAGLRVLAPDGTGLPSQYEPSDAWTAFTRLGEPEILGDGTTPGDSDRVVVVSPISGPVEAHCLTMQLTVDQRDGRVIEILTAAGSVQAVAADDGAPLLIFQDPVTGTQLQLFGEGHATLEDVIAVAGTVAVR